MRELAIPVAEDRLNPVEMARIWVTTEEGRSHVSLHFGMYDDVELEMWGSLTADLIAHVVRAYQMEGGEEPTEAVFAAIEKGLRARLSDNPTMRGEFSGRALS